MTDEPILIGSEIYRTSSYGHRHPLAIPRVSAALDLIRAMGWLDERRYLDSPRATQEQLARFHAADYIAAVLQHLRHRMLSQPVDPQPRPQPAQLVRDRQVPPGVPETDRRGEVEHPG